jgi:NAD(P)H-flavin reductase
METTAEVTRQMPVTDPMIPSVYRIQRVRRETHDTFTFEAQPEGSKEVRPFAPGQFNMLYAYGMGEVPISISGDPTDTTRIVHTIRAVGAVTKPMRGLKRGDQIGVRGPFGSHWPVDESTGSDIVIVAGGIGLAPLRPALYRLIAERDRYGKIVLLYGARTPEDILFNRELKEWRAQLDLDVHVTVDRATTDWRGNVGVVTTLFRKTVFDPESTVAMVCGPEVMMHFAIIELQRRGLPAANIFLSMERNMKCAVGFCGHCQYGPTFICKDGPVFPYSRIGLLFATREI